MKTYDKIIAKIRDARLKSGLTQEQMANFLHLNRATYMNIEAGKRPLNLDELELICDILNLSFEDIIAPDHKNLEYKSEKFKQLYYYILKTFFSEHGIPKTKLAKLLYIIDFTYFYIYGESMTGASYYRNHYGPVAKDFLALTDELFENGQINIKVLDFAQLISISTTNNDTNFNVFDDKEKEVISMVCDYWKDKRTSEIVNFTHSQKAWSERMDGEFIPYLAIKSELVDHVYAPTDKRIKELA